MGLFEFILIFLAILVYILFYNLPERYSKKEEEHYNKWKEEQEEKQKEAKDA